MNYVTPTVNPIGCKENKNRQGKRVYDNPATPYQQLTATSILPTTQQNELESFYQSINPAELTQEIIPPSTPPHQPRTRENHDTDHLP
ncbi:hypothetical protein [Arcanobacterium haemolyticum]